MFNTVNRLYSNHLLGIEKDHSADKYAATLRSTGFMEFWPAGKELSDPHYWWIEMHCDTCKSDVLESHPDWRPRIEKALREHGLHKP